MNLAVGVTGILPPGITTIVLEKLLSMVAFTVALMLMVVVEREGICTVSESGPSGVCAVRRGVVGDDVLGMPPAQSGSARMR